MSSLNVLIFLVSHTIFYRFSPFPLQKTNSLLTTQFPTTTTPFATTFHTTASNPNTSTAVFMDGWVQILFVSFFF